MMLIFWIPYLLFGSITCGPVLKAHGPQAAPVAVSEPVEVPLPYHLGSWRRRVSANRGNTAGPASAYAGSYSGHNMAAGSGPQAAPVAVSEPVEVPLPYHAGSNMAGGSEFNRGYAGYGVEAHGAPEHGGYEVYATSHASGYEGSAPSGSYGSASGYGGSSSYGYVSHQDGASSGSDGNAGPEAPEPVFSDVSDLEPVYSFSSRSSYQRGRSVFAQTRYSPGEPAPPVMPVYKLVRKTSTGSGPAAAPAKGRF